jgi:hypothetical protein
MVSGSEQLGSGCEPEPDAKNSATTRDGLVFASHRLRNIQQI